MPDHDATHVPRLDAAGVRAVLRRLEHASEPPWLHQEVARRMAERLALIRLQPQRIVDWWSFLGASAPLLARTYPKAQRVAVEPDETLADRTRDALRRARWSPLRLFGSQPEVFTDDVQVPGGAQLVWANMMLHAIDDPPSVIARWQRALAADGFVMFSCLGPGTLRELRGLYARLGWGPATIDFVDMHDLGDMLVHAGFADPVMDQETIRLTWPDPQAALLELRRLGGNVARQRFAGLRTPRWRMRLERELRTLVEGADGRLALSFEISYGHAFKALPKVKAGEATTVSLDEMRTLVRSRRGSSGSPLCAALNSRG